MRKERKSRLGFKNKRRMRYRLIQVLSKRVRNRRKRKRK
jgi:hypothetical protein